MEISTTLGELSEKTKHLKMPSSTRIRLIIEEQEFAPKTTKVSKWVQFAENIKKDPVNLGDYTQEDERVRKEFQDNFVFSNNA